MDSTGEVVTELTGDAMDGVVEQVRASGADACAVCLLFAFRNPEHENRVAAAIRSALPHVSVCTSFEVQPEFREFERFSTTVLNAYLQPVLGRYISTLEEGLARVAPEASIGINQSSGGLMSPERARALPVRTALSGPAAGAVGAAYSAKLSGRRYVITLDMGGTSADVALIRDFQADISFERNVAGFSVRLPAVDIETVGAGGGSIAWFDRDGLLKVGPASAGADPGPACYGARRRPTHGDGREPRARTVVEPRSARRRDGARRITLARRVRTDRRAARIRRRAHRARRARHRRGQHGARDPDHLRGAWIRPAQVHPDGLRRRRTAPRARRCARSGDERDPRARGAGDPVCTGSDRLRSEGGLRSRAIVFEAMRPVSSAWPGTSKP